MPSNERKPDAMHQDEAAFQTQRKVPNIPTQPVDTQAAPPSDLNTAQDMSPREEIELIKKENLTGRQLRIARRIAQKHGLQTTSDLDAVRLLRSKGIDPFQASNNMLKTAAQNPLSGTPSNLPATVRHADVANAEAPIDHAQRQLDVHQIQIGLVRRRRRRVAALVTKLICFILIPTLLAGYYFYRVATPMYASFTEFVIQKSDSPAAAGASSLLKGSLLATAQDSISVQGYLSSRDAMARLDQDLDFRQAFQDDRVDILQRLDPDVTNEATYRAYKKRVQIGFDPTEGIIKMEVVAPSPELAYNFSKALISYAEQNVDQLTQRLRKDQMQGASAAYEKAENNFASAQDRIVQLQEQLGVLSPEGEIAAQMTLIQQIETDIQLRQLELIELIDNPRPNKTKVSVLERSIKNRKDLVKKLRLDMTTGAEGVSSLAKITAELQAAQAQLVLRQELLGVALLQLETARVEANRQTRYLSLSVPPVTPDEASYPKAFESTALAALVFAGLFLLISLTASILREQVTG